MIHPMREDYHEPVAIRDEFGTRMVRCPVTGHLGPGYLYLSDLRPIGDTARWICERCATPEEMAAAVDQIVDYRKRHGRKPRTT
jgi:hypothetical protein